MPPGYKVLGSNLSVLQSQRAFLSHRKPAKPGLYQLIQAKVQRQGLAYPVAVAFPSDFPATHFSFAMFKTDDATVARIIFQILAILEGPEPLANWKGNAYYK
jgi:hypothetical protein